MRSIDVTMLQYLKPFFYVAETGSIRRAAEQLFLAPSAVSHQICQLEKILGYPLFERRGGRALRLLPAGRVLYERIPMLDNELFLLRSEMRNCQTEPEKISIGVFTQYRKILLSCLSGYSRATGRLDRVCLTESSDGDQLDLEKQRDRRENGGLVVWSRQALPSYHCITSKRLPCRGRRTRG